MITFLTILAMVLVGFSLPFILARIGLTVIRRGTSTQTPSATTSPASASPAPRATQPKAKDSLSVGGAILLLGALAIVGYGIYAIATVVATNRPTPVAKTEPRWGEVQTLHLTGEKVRVPWKEGAIRYETHLAKGENQSRRYWLKSGDRQSLFGEEDGTEGLEIYHGQPCYLWSADGKPLDVIFQWKIKN